MKTTIIILTILVSLLYLKWILIIVVFPFQVIHGQIIKKWGNGKNIPFIYKVLKKPYTIWEKLFKKGWQRYMLFQVGLIPFHHIRRFIYSALGAEIGKNVVFHFRTEIRGVNRLKIGSGTIIGDNALLDARRGLTIGKNVNLASDVTIHPGGHTSVTLFSERQPWTAAPWSSVTGYISVLVL